MNCYLLFLAHMYGRMYDVWTNIFINLSTLKAGLLGSGKSCVDQYHSVALEFGPHAYVPDGYK